MEIQDIVERAKSLDKEALATLCDMYYDKVFYYILSECKDRTLAEDLTNETFIRVVRNISDNKTNFTSWLFTIARNVINDYYRKNKKESQLSYVSHDSDSNDPLEYSCLYSMIGKLPADQREVLQLRFISDLAIKKVASIINRSEGAIKQLQYRALSKLRELMKENCDE